MSPSSQLLRSCWLLALTALAACGDPVDTRPLPATPLPAPVGPAAFSTELNAYMPGVQWSADGRTIYAVNRQSAAVPYGIVAIDVASGQTRTVVPATNISIQVLRISADGNFLFYSSERLPPSGGGHSIFRLPTTGSGAEELVRSASHVFTISQDGRVLAWKSHTGDSTFIRDLATGETRHVANGGFPLYVSPDYTTLLHGTTPPFGPIASAIATGIGTAMQGRLEDVRWDAAGPEMLYWGQEGRVMVQRGITSPREVLWAPAAEHSWYQLQSATWSPDGRHVAASLALACFSAPCRQLLVLINAANGTARVVVDDAAPLIGRATFSPDGRRVAVTSGGRMYVIDLP
jgi:hypothetical protein